MTDKPAEEAEVGTTVADGATYDVFLSHNSADKPDVLELAKRLRSAGISPFLDAWHLVPGEPWQEALEEAILASRTCAVFVGPAGFGTWENEEMRAALSRRAHDDEFRVIPIILPGAVLPAKGRLPPFLSRLTWVDFRPGLDDSAAFDRLVNGIRGLAPAEDEEEADDRAEIVCPFRGLEVFDEEHAQYFFGREALTQYLVEQLRDDRFLAVLGPSGSGKSSVVRAGLIPQLRAGELPGSGTWHVAIVKPGPHPMEALASRLAGELTPDGDALAARETILANLRENERGLHAVVQTALGESGVDARVVVVVDQFEEIFTLCHDDAERAAFVDSLLYASSLVGGQTVVVATMRADFFGKCATLPVLAARLADRDVLVPPMDHDELRRAMILPAEKAGLQFEKGLVDTILDDLGDEPGSLPLLQHTLLELFEGRRERWLTIDRYHEIGGVRGAIAQRAEAVYGRLTPEQQVTARRVLLRLTEPGEGTEDTRRRAPVTELLPAGASPDAVEAVVNQLADARLLVTSENDTGDEVVDVAHEALIRGWPRLQAWIGENPLALRIHRRITETATEWSAASRDPSYLFGGQRLEEALRWSADNDGDLNDLEREFLEASKAARLKDEASRRRRTRFAIAGTAVAMVAITGALVVALASWGEAEGSRRELAGRLLASEGQRRALTDPLLGLRMELEGLARVDGRGDAATDIRDIVIDQLKTARTQSLGVGVSNAWVTPDRKYAIVRGDTETSIWRLADRTRVALLPVSVCEVFVPAGDDVGIAEITNNERCFTDGDSIELRRLSDGALLASSDTKLLDQADKPAEHAAILYRNGEATDLIALADGRTLASSGTIELLSGFDRAIVGKSDGTAELIDTIGGSRIADLGAFTDLITDPTSGGGFLTVLRDNTCSVWSTATGTKAGTTPSCTRLTVSRDGSVAAITTADHIELIDLAESRSLGNLGPEVWRVELSPDQGATTLVAMSKGAPVRLLRTADLFELARYEGAIVTEEDLGEGGSAVSYSEDGRLVHVRVGDYFDVPFERRSTIRSTSNGDTIELKASSATENAADATLSNALFSPDPEATYIHAFFTNNTQRMFRAADLSVVDIEDGFLNATFFPPPLGLVAILHPYGGIELRAWHGGTTLGDLPGSLASDITEIPGTDPPLAIVTYDDTSESDRRPVLVDATGVLMQFKTVGSVEVSPDAQGSSFVDGGEIWSRVPEPRILATLARPELDARFDSTGTHLLVGDYANGTAYLVDMVWLKQLASVDWEKTSNPDLIRLVCNGPGGTQVDRAALATAMQEVRPGVPASTCLE